MQTNTLPGAESLVRAVAEASRDPVLVFDSRCRINLCNVAALRLLGRTELELIGLEIWRAIPEVRRQALFAQTDGRPGDDQDEPVLHPSERTGVRLARWSVHPLFDDRNELAGGFCQGQGARWSSDVERQLRQSERRFRDFVESASDWFWETDPELRYSYVSERYQDATGLPPSSRLGRRRGDFRMDGPDDGDWASHIADLEAHRPFRDFTFAYVDSCGRRRVARVSGRPVFDDDGVFAGYRGVGRDITTEVEAQKQIRFLAQHDPLTGLPNRSLLKDRLKQVLAAARRTQRSLAVLCIDLDDFKLVNDTLGHAAGDALLCEMARRMRDTVREMDTVARLGGDEFTIVQTEPQGWEDVKSLAERLIQGLSEPFIMGGEQVHCGASIGVSLYPADGDDADELIRHADLALYKAKAGGRNTCRFFLPAMNEEVRERRQVEDDLRDALNRSLLTLHYQPQIDLASGCLVGIEALVRWQHPTRGLLTPSSFISIAERSGLILRIDRWVLREACQQAERWRKAGLLSARIAVNLSAVRLARGDLVDDITAVLNACALPASQLEIEITESVLLTDTDSVGQALTALHDLGVHLAVDDFGTGYSSLTYLRRFPVQKVKIDRSFIASLCSNSEDAAIARAIISLGHSLGLQVVAEGVETKEQLDYLQNVRCDGAQGYYIAKPMSATDCEAFLREAARRARPKVHEIARRKHSYGGLGAAGM